MHDSYFSALDGPPLARRLLRALSPSYLVSRAARYLPGRFLPAQIYLDSLERPAYAYGLYTAALQAKTLGYDRLAAIEFGVASGHGLVAMERLAGRIGAYLGVEIEVHGFDTGAGMPKPLDYRDHPYLWQEGDYAMDVEGLRGRLTNTHLWLGPVAETLPNFARETVAPVGFISVDLDYYSSTVEALRIFDLGPATRLPRVVCYFDDVGGPDYAFFTEAAGELLAIAEFNQAHEALSISRLRSLSHTKLIAAPWHSQTYVLHDFHHPRYADNLLPDFRKDLGSIETVKRGQGAFALEPRAD